MGSGAVWVVDVDVVDSVWLFDGEAMVAVVVDSVESTLLFEIPFPFCAFGAGAYVQRRPRFLHRSQFRWPLHLTFAERHGSHAVIGRGVSGFDACVSGGCQFRTIVPGICLLREEPEGVKVPAGCGCDMEGSQTSCLSVRYNNRYESL